MTRIPFRTSQAMWLKPHAMFLIALLGLKVFFQVVSNCGFKLSATSGNVRGFWTWQVVGNLAGLASVITITVVAYLTNVSLYRRITI